MSGMYEKATYTTHKTVSQLTYVFSIVGSKSLVCVQKQSITLSVIIGFLLGAWPYYIALLTTSLGMATFIVKTFRLIAPAGLWQKCPLAFSDCCWLFWFCVFFNKKKRWWRWRRWKQFQKLLFVVRWRNTDAAVLHSRSFGETFNFGRRVEQCSSCWKHCVNT